MPDKPTARLAEGVPEPIPENALPFEVPPPVVVPAETPGPAPRSGVPTPPTDLDKDKPLPDPVFITGTDWQAPDTVVPPNLATPYDPDAPPPDIPPVSPLPPTPNPFPEPIITKESQDADYNRDHRFDDRSSQPDAELAGDASVQSGGEPDPGDTAAGGDPDADAPERARDDAGTRKRR